MENKRCTKCGEVKELSEFYKRKGTKDGFFGHCKACVKIHNAKRQKENPEKAREYIAKWRKENTEKARANNAKWAKKNPEKVKASNAKWYKENSEKVMVDVAKWKKENPEKVKASTKRWVKKNPEKVKTRKIRFELKQQIGETPPPELVEIKLLIYKTKKLCKTLKN